MENEKIAALLYDLAGINLERARAYEEASFQNQVFDVELRTTFALLANQSRQNMYMLNLYVEKLLARMHAPRPTYGSLYKNWKNTAAYYTGNNRRAMLQSCDAGEKAMITLYEQSCELPPKAELREMLQNQLRGFESSLATIKKMLEVTSKVDQRGVI
jgi:hypothetical protein